MTINRGTIFQRQSPEAGIPVGGPTIIGIIGLAGVLNASLEPNVPTLISSLAEAKDAFGNAGALTSGIDAIFRNQAGRVVAVAKDDYSDKVAGITVTSGGTGYSSVPTVTITGGGGTGATALARRSSGGVVTSVRLITRGSGYTSNPNVAFSGGGGSGAVATAFRGTAIGAESAVDAVEALRETESLTGLRLTMLCGNGETNLNAAGATQNPVAVALNDLAVDLKAVGFIDTHELEPIDWLGNNSYSNLIPVANPLNVAVGGSKAAGSAWACGIMAREDIGIDGIASSPDNKLVDGAIQSNVRIPYSELATSHLHQLDALGALSFVYRNGLRTFGGLTGGVGIYENMPVLRIAYKIENDTKEIADTYRGRRPIGAFISTVNGRFQDYLQTLVNDDIIISGTSQPDADYNNLAANIENGRLQFNFVTQVAIANRLMTLRLEQVV